MAPSTKKLINKTEGSGPKAINKTGGLSPTAHGKRVTVLRNLLIEYGSKRVE